jgi:O-acetyl-ADP-ribose deacetylase (regulator of RNase III)
MERSNNNEKELLASAYVNSLKIAEEKKFESVAFPNISTGIYGFPKKPAAEIAIAAVSQFMKTAKSVKQVTFVCFDEENFKIYQQMLS